METVKLHDKTFAPFIERNEIEERLDHLSEKINEEYAGKQPLFISVLNGAFMFTADLLKRVNFDCEVTFMRVSSYDGDQTTGKVKEVIGLTENIEGRDIVIVEDIVDTGITINKIYADLEFLRPASIKVATLFFKPDKYKKNVPIDFVGFEIPEAFIVGYGLDYDGLGRNLPEIYQVSD